MKVLFLLGAVFVCAVTAQAFDLAQFCITVNETCGDGQQTTGTHQMGANDSLTYFYVEWETPSDSTELDIYLDIDGWPLGSLTNKCGCGRTSIGNITIGSHLVRVVAQCEVGYLAGGVSCPAGTAAVRVYSPAGNACRQDGPNP